MRVIILTAAAAMTLAACSGSKSEQNADTAANVESNMMMTDPNIVMDQNMTADGTLNAGGADGNAATNGADENALRQQDLNTNDRDSNLANGL